VIAQSKGREHHAPGPIPFPISRLHSRFILQHNKAAMTTLQTLETAVAPLDRAELAQFRQWFGTFNSDAWDAQIEADAGRLDAFAAEALAEYHAGHAREIT